MNKKILAVLTLALAIGTTNVFAFGIGAQGGYVAGSSYSGGALTFKLDDNPWVFAVNADLGSNYLGLGVTGDMWLAHETFADPFAYYYGWGLAGSFATAGDNTNLFAGVRAVGGVNVMLLDNFLELYGQVAWQPGINIWVAGDSGIDPVFFSFPVNLGFRFWLK